MNGIAALPRAGARWFSPLHNGAVQSYAISMMGGAVLIALLMLYMPEIVSYLQSLSSQQTEVEKAMLLMGGTP